MLGPSTHLSLAGVRIESVPAPSGERLRLVAERDVSGIATGRFARPAVGVRWQAAGFADGVEFCGFAFTQFAFPVVADASLGFDFTPSDGVRSPSAVLPLIVRCGAEVQLLAPLVGAHEQVIAVGSDSLTWGWHGDLDAVPAGTVTELGRYRGASVVDVLSAWTADLAPVDRVADNPLQTHLSYWTDNGAAYWYRTEAGRSIVDSVVDAVTSLRADDVPVRAVELDSWWYQHESAPPITDIGYPDGVPPSGTSRWRPRADAFQRDGEGELPMSAVGDVARRLEGAPLVLHARHISPSSTYVSEGRAAGEVWWVDEGAAHPADPAFFGRWFDDAADHGVVVIEQDWMLMFWFWVRELRSQPGRARTWQQAMNAHAQRTGVDLLWCMATPADLVEASQLDRVVAVRTSDDYRYAADPAELWTWFLTVNRLAEALGLPVFKDVFFSNARVDERSDPIDGDPHAELEAALAALSGGVVGIGDRQGRTDRSVVMRTCDDDGRLRRVDRPIAFVDHSLFGAPRRGDSLAWATTTATTADGVWTYVLAVNTAAEHVPITDRIGLGSASAVLDWRSGNWSVDNAIEATLAPRDWSLSVVAPSSLTAHEASRRADPARYVAVEAER